MADAAIKASRRVLAPADRMAEILFGLIMALTFTCSISVATDGQTEVRTMLLGALGCNVAWGLIDGVFYLIGCLAEKAHALGTLRAVRSSGDPSAAALLIAEALPRAVASVLTREEIETVRLRLLALPEPARAARLDADDGRGAVAVAILVFLATLPVVVPFLLVEDVLLALRISNGIAMAILFIAGHELGRASGGRPWAMGIAMVVIGGLMVSLCIALGG